MKKTKLLKEQTLFVKGKVKGVVQLHHNTESNQYTVYGELYEDPRLECEKSFKFKPIALWKLFWLRRELQSTYVNKEHIWNWYVRIEHPEEREE